MTDTLLLIATFCASIAIYETIRIVYFEIRLAKIMKQVKRHFELIDRDIELIKENGQ